MANFKIFVNSCMDMNCAKLKRFQYYKNPFINKAFEINFNTSKATFKEFNRDIGDDTALSEMTISSI